MQIQWLGEGADYWLWGGSECVISGWWGSESRFRGDGEWGGGVHADLLVGRGRSECRFSDWWGSGCRFSGWGDGVNADLVLEGWGMNADSVAGGGEE